MRLPSTNRPPLRRPSFTLVELLVVISIIAVLVALSAAATIRFIGTQQGSNTKAELNALGQKLNKQWSAVKDTAFKEPIPPAANAWIMANLAGTDANATARARVIYVKLKLRSVFPMNFTEALTAPPGFPTPYASYLKGQGITGTTGQPWESSACLLLALQRGESGGGLETDKLGAGAVINCTVPGTAITIPALMDGWGQPLTFARFPTNTPQLNPNGAQPGNRDPLDPQGYLNYPQWGTTYGKAYSGWTQQALAPASTPTLSYRIAPLIVSSGPDKTLGVDPFSLAVQSPAANDNLYSSAP